MNKDLLILSGPTAVGKTEISIKLAKSLNGEIISADSMQIYKLMDIGSAKISKEEMQGVPHHMIDIVDPSQEFSVSEYKYMTEEIIKDIHSRGKLPMLVGGTGLYIDSIICNLNFTDSAKDDDYRDYLWKLAEEKGNEYIHSMLKDVDLESFDNIHPNNRKRVIRALEVYKTTGKPFSAYKAGEELYNVPYNVHYYVLTMDRDKLYSRINKRVDIMMERGLLEEVKKLTEMGFTADMQSMKGIGYKELIHYLEGTISLDNAVELIKQGSRNYAKRQLTWFRKDPRVHYIDKDLFKTDDEVVRKIIDDIEMQ